eukprot:20076-Eustigmatos_ZCMA.PRE.1
MIKQYAHVKEADPNIKSFAGREDVGDAFFHIIMDHYRNEPVTLTQDMMEFCNEFSENDEMK